MYLPMIPRHSNWMPPINKKIDTIEGQPAVGSPNNNARAMINKIAIPEPIQERAPVKEAIVSGASEKLTIPSIE